MREKILLFFSTAFLAFLVAACQTGTAEVAKVPVANATPVVVSSVPTPADDAPRISLADAKAAFDSGKALFVDTRPDSAYKADHIKGAVNITAGDLQAKIKDLPHDRKIIAYCS